MISRPEVVVLYGSEIIGFRSSSAFFDALDVTLIPFKFSDCGEVAMIFPFAFITIMELKAVEPRRNKSALRSNRSPSSI